jgi:hypothetical protein
LRAFSLRSLRLKHQCELLHKGTQSCTKGFLGEVTISIFV